MPEQTDYFNKYLESKFTHIDTSIQGVNNTMSDLKAQFIDLRREVKADNKYTRYWITGIAISVLVGFAAISVAIFFGFSKLQTSWIQSAFSLVGKAITK